MTKYKVLNGDMKSPWLEHYYEIGKGYHCSDFDEDKSAGCSRGYYATDIDGLPYTFRCNQDHRVFEVEASGKSVEIPPYKCRYEDIMLIRELDKPEIIRMAKEKEVEIGYMLSEVLYPVNPLMIPTVDRDDLSDLMVTWASVWASVGDSVRDSVWASVGASVWDSVGASVWDSVRASVWASVWDSVGDSVGDSVWAYLSSLFPNIKTWKYIGHQEGINPYQSCIDLWRSGYVPSFTGSTWRLHAGSIVDVVLEVKA